MNEFTTPPTTPFNWEPSSPPPLYDGREDPVSPPSAPKEPPSLSWGSLPPPKMQEGLPVGSAAPPQFNQGEYLQRIVGKLYDTRIQALAKLRNGDYSTDELTKILAESDRLLVIAINEELPGFKDEPEPVQRLYFQHWENGHLAYPIDSIEEVKREILSDQEGTALDQARMATSKLINPTNIFSQMGKVATWAGPTNVAEFFQNMNKVAQESPKRTASENLRAYLQMAGAGVIELWDPGVTERMTLALTDPALMGEYQGFWRAYAKDSVTEAQSFIIDTVLIIPQLYALGRGAQWFYKLYKKPWDYTYEQYYHWRAANKPDEEKFQGLVKEIRGRPAEYGIYGTAAGLINDGARELGVPPHKSGFMLTYAEHIKLLETIKFLNIDELTDAYGYQDKMTIDLMKEGPIAELINEYKKRIVLRYEEAARLHKLHFPDEPLSKMKPSQYMNYTGEKELREWLAKHPTPKYNANIKDPVALAKQKEAFRAWMDDYYKAMHELVPPSHFTKVGVPTDLPPEYRRTLEDKIANSKAEFSAYQEAKASDHPSYRGTSTEVLNWHKKRNISMLTEAINSGSMYEFFIGSAGQMRYFLDRVAQGNLLISPEEDPWLTYMTTTGLDAYHTEQAYSALHNVKKLIPEVQLALEQVSPDYKRLYETHNLQIVRVNKAIKETYRTGGPQASVDRKALIKERRDLVKVRDAYFQLSRFGNPAGKMSSDDAVWFLDEWATARDVMARLKSGKISPKTARAMYAGMSFPRMEAMVEAVKRDPRLLEVMYKYGLHIKDTNRKVIDLMYNIGQFITPAARDELYQMADTFVPIHWKFIQHFGDDFDVRQMTNKMMKEFIEKSRYELRNYSVHNPLRAINDRPDPSKGKKIRLNSVPETLSQFINAITLSRDNLVRISIGELIQSAPDLGAVGNYDEMVALYGEKDVTRYTQHGRDMGFHTKNYELMHFLQMIHPTTLKDMVGWQRNVALTVRAFGVPTKMTNRAITTCSLTFFCNNISRDFQDTQATLLAELGVNASKKFTVDFASGRIHSGIIAAMLGQDHPTWSLKNEYTDAALTVWRNGALIAPSQRVHSGADPTIVQNMFNNEIKHLKNLNPGFLTNLFTKVTTLEDLQPILKLLDAGNKLGEQASRVATFYIATKSGMALRHALLYSQQITGHFAETGIMSKWLGNFYPIFNARVAGVHRTFQKITNPNSVPVIAGLLTTGFALAFLADLLDPRLKHTGRSLESFNLPATEGTMIAIPRGHGLAAALVMGQWTYDFMRSAPEEQAGKYMELLSFLQNLESPVALPNLHTDDTNYLASLYNVSKPVIIQILEQLHVGVTPEGYRLFTPEKVSEEYLQQLRPNRINNFYNSQATNLKILTSKGDSPLTDPAYIDWAAGRIKATLNAAIVPRIITEALHAMLSVAADNPNEYKFDPRYVTVGFLRNKATLLDAQLYDRIKSRLNPEYTKRLTDKIKNTALAIGNENDPRFTPERKDKARESLQNDLQEMVETAKMFNWFVGEKMLSSMTAEMQRLNSLSGNPNTDPVIRHKMYQMHLNLMRLQLMLLKGLAEYPHLTQTDKKNLRSSEIILSEAIEDTIKTAYTKGGPALEDFDKTIFPQEANRIIKEYYPFLTADPSTQQGARAKPPPRSPRNPITY